MAPMKEEETMSAIQSEQTQDTLDTIEHEVRPPADADETDMPEPVPGWVAFRGTTSVSKREGRIVLSPDEAPSIRIEMNINDVRAFDELILVREHGRVFSFHVPPAIQRLWRRGPNSDVDCGESGSRCVGDVKWCCESDDEPVGSCNGEWLCPPPRSSQS